MTDDMEDRLRTVLRDRAGIPVAAGDPVVGVRDRMLRRSRRRGIAVGSTAALCVAGIAIAAAALAGNDTSSRPIGPAVISSNPPRTTPPSPTSAPSPSAPSSAVASAPPSAPATPVVVAPSSSAPTETLPSNVSSLPLPSGTFDGLSTGSSQLFVTGAGGSPSNSECVQAPINTGGPGLGGITAASCDGPPWPGDRAWAVVGNPYGAGDFATTVAIRRVSTTTGAITTGPIVMRFNEASDTHIATAEGGGSLWIYDVDTTNGPEALQVSETTGQVDDVVRTPQLYRPIMVANGDGLWLGNSNQGSPVDGTVFHVAAGSSTVTTVVSSATDAVDWMLAEQRPRVGWHPTRGRHFDEPLALRRSKGDGRVSRTRAHS